MYQMSSTGPSYVKSESSISEIVADNDTKPLRANLPVDD
jgi:hypothetical protein